MRKLARRPQFCNKGRNFLSGETKILSQTLKGNTSLCQSMYVRMNNKEGRGHLSCRLSSGRGRRRARLPGRPRPIERAREEAAEGLHPAEPQVLPRARMQAAAGARAAERHRRAGPLLNAPRVVIHYRLVDCARSVVCRQWKDSLEALNGHWC